MPNPLPPNTLRLASHPTEPLETHAHPDTAQKTAKSEFARSIAGAPPSRVADPLARPSNLAQNQSRTPPPSRLPLEIPPPPRFFSAAARTRWAVHQISKPFPDSSSR